MVAHLLFPVWAAQWSELHLVPDQFINICVFITQKMQLLNMLFNTSLDWFVSQLFYHFDYKGTYYQSYWQKLWLTLSLSEVICFKHVRLISLTYKYLARLHWICFKMHYAWVEWTPSHGRCFINRSSNLVLWWQLALRWPIYLVASTQCNWYTFVHALL